MKYVVLMMLLTFVRNKAAMCVKFEAIEDKKRIRRSELIEK